MLETFACVVTAVAGTAVAVAGAAHADLGVVRTEAANAKEERDA